MNLYTTSLPVSQRIKELVGEMETTFAWCYRNNPSVHIRSGYGWWDYPGHHSDMICYTLLLSELPEVLKKVGEKLGWSDIPAAEWDDLVGNPPWLHYWLQIAELHALGQNVDDNLMELLK